MHARFLRLRRQPAPAIPRTYRRRHPLQPRAKRPPRIVRGNAAGCPDRQSAAAAAPKHWLLDQMEPVAFLLHGTFEGKKTIDIFVCGKAAMSEEESVRFCSDDCGIPCRPRSCWR